MALLETMQDQLLLVMDLAEELVQLILVLLGVMVQPIQVVEAEVLLEQVVQQVAQVEKV